MYVQVCVYIMLMYTIFILTITVLFGMDTLDVGIMVNFMQVYKSCSAE